VLCLVFVWFMVRIVLLVLFDSRLLWFVFLFVSSLMLVVWWCLIFVQSAGEEYVIRSLVFFLI